LLVIRIQQLIRSLARNKLRTRAGVRGLAPTVWVLTSLIGLGGSLGCTAKKEDTGRLTIQFPGQINGSTTKSSNSKSSPVGSPDHSIFGASASQVEKSLSVQAQSLSEPNWNSATPANLSEIGCYAVFVGGSSPELSNNACQNTQNTEIMRFGQLVGTFAAGSTATLEVPAGKSMRFYVAGLKLVSGQCEKFAISSEGHPSLTWSQYSMPYLIGQRTLDIAPGENNVEITANSALDDTTKINSCNFLSAPGSTGLIQVSSPTLVPNVAFGTFSDTSFTVSNLSSVYSLSGFAASSTGTEFSVQSTTCGTSLAPQASCTVVVRYTPSTVGTSSGQLNLSATANGVAQSATRSFSTNSVVGSVTVGALYTGKSAWTDYVQAASTYAAPTNCGGMAESGATSCIHAGEFRRVDFALGLGSCAGVTATDTLNAFTWVCDDTSMAPTVILRTSKMNVTSPLRQLIDFSGSPQWKTNSITVVKSGVTVAQSSPAVWWSNVVMALPTTGATLNSTTAIYATATNINLSGTNQGYNIAAHNVSVVTAAGASINLAAGASANCNPSTGSTTSPTVISVFCMGSRNYTWIEADVNVASVTSGTLINAVSSSFLRVMLSKFLVDVASNTWMASDWRGVRNSILAGTTFIGTREGSYLKDSTFNVLYKSNWDGIRGTASIGLSLEGTGGPTSYNRVSEVRISRFDSGIELIGTNPVTGNAITNFNINNVTNGIWQDQNASSNLVYRGVISGAGDGSTDGNGIYVTDGTGLKVSHVTVIGAYFSGASILNPSSGTQLHQFLVANAEWGIDVGINDVATDLRLSQFAGVATNINPIWGGTSVSLTSQGTHLVKNTNACDWNGATNCNAQGGNFAAYMAIESDFVGNTNDSLNTTTNAATNGATGLSYYASMDFINFENFARVLTTFATNFTANASLTNAFNSGSGGIYDWSLKSTAGKVRNHSGDATNPNGTFTVGAACPAAVSGTLSGMDNSSQLYLFNAAEILDDGIGNDDGLCHANEHCLYSPNFGYYQGHGDYSGRTCVYSAGAGPAGITIYGYPNNGY